MEIIRKIKITKEELEVIKKLYALMHDELEDYDYCIDFVEDVAKERKTSCGYALEYESEVDE